MICENQNKICIIIDRNSFYYSSVFTDCFTNDFQSILL